MSRSDRRTRREKLAAMAGQTRQSPNEAAIAERMLREATGDIDAGAIYAERRVGRMVAAPPRSAVAQGVYWPHYIRYVEPAPRTPLTPPVAGIVKVENAPRWAEYSRP